MLYFEIIVNRVNANNPLSTAIFAASGAELETAKNHVGKS